MVVYVAGKRIETERPDARIVFKGDSYRYYRLEECLYGYDDALVYLTIICRFTEEEAKQYLNSLPSDYEE